MRHYALKIKAEEDALINEWLADFLPWIERGIWISAEQKSHVEGNEKVVEITAHGMSSVCRYQLATLRSPLPPLAIKSCLPTNEGSRMQHQLFTHPLFKDYAFERLSVLISRESSPIGRISYQITGIDSDGKELLKKSGVAGESSLRQLNQQLDHIFYRILLL